jgi:hypothetical protein
LKLTAAATKAACVDIQLVQERDGKHQLPATNLFTEAEIETLEALVPTLEGSTHRQKNPHPPGPITFRRGMEQFHAIHRGHQLVTARQQDVRIP